MRFLEEREEVEEINFFLSLKIFIFVHMLRMITHIEHLLLSHDCVIIPHFGGFVLQILPAVFRAEDHTFCPMRKEVVFNEALQHTDGLLSESYMRVYGVDYKQASLMLEEDIESLKSTLGQTREVEFGKVGKFSLGVEGQLIFTPGESAIFNAAAYGLPSFQFPLLSSMPEGREEAASLVHPRRDVFYIPVNRKLMQVVAASAAAVALFFLVSTPVKEVNHAAYTASFVPTEIIKSHVTEEAEATSEIVPMTEESQKEKRKISVPAADKAKESNVSFLVQEAKTDKKMYYIVIASFPGETQAKEYMSGIDRAACKNAGILLRDGKYRIYADKFADRAEAEKYMVTLRREVRYKDAWLFASR